MGFKEVLLRYQFHVILLTGVVLGISLGMIMNTLSLEYSSRIILYVGFPSELYNNMWTGFSLPLITSHIVLSFGSVSPRLLRRFGRQFCIYLILTKLEAGILAVCFGLIFRSGENVHPPAEPDDLERHETIALFDFFLDMIRNSFPENVLNTAMQYVRTNLTDTNNYTIDELVQWEVVKGGRKINFPNVMGLVSVSVIAGITLNVMGEQSQYVLSLTRCCMRATTVIAMWSMWFAPIGIMSMIAKDIIQLGDIPIYYQNITRFSVMMCTTLTMQIVFYSLMYLVIVRKNPIKFFWNFSEAMAAAFATGTSYATLPMSIVGVQDKNHVEARVVNFVLPIGTCINRDGTVIWLMLSMIFIHESYKIPLSIGDLCALVVVCGVTSLACAPIPGASFEVLQILLRSLAVPVDIIFLLGLEWLYDRFSTVVNVCGDAVGASILEKLNQQSLADIPDINAPLNEEHI